VSAVALRPILAATELDQNPAAGRMVETDREFLEGVVEIVTQSPRRLPWCAYLALAEDGAIVGACCFKQAPLQEEVEIAYATLPSCEGRGFAGAMVAALVGIARGDQSAARVIAHTLPERNASTRVLGRSGFACEGEAIDPEDGLVWRWSIPLADEPPDSG